MGPPSDERPFDVIPYEDIQGNWKKLGSGSFGNVYKGTYLGIDVAIKEVLPSNDYDVSKYFEREWRLMKECRHPNVVLYLGLSRAPEPDGRIFIISEFIENGNLRYYIHDKSKPFPWKLRLSFATDIARALAYLHARKCLHRDLKGENLLVTSNGRLKITDFGFARIAARNAEESKRLTFCGTDAYMSPEILLGDEFGLSTDIFSLGIILCEIGARKLADDRTFKRGAPTFGIDEKEVHALLGKSPGCPPAFLQLALDCLSQNPILRPNMITILQRLRDIELEVLARPSEADDVHVGSVKFITGHKRPGPAPRIPSFGMGVAKDVGKSSNAQDSSGDEGSSDEEQLIEAIKSLDVDLNGSSHRALLSGHHGDSDSEYSTTVVRSHPTQHTNTVPPSLSSILTIRSPQPTETDDAPIQATIKTIDSYHTAASSISVAAATEGGSLNHSTIRGGIDASPSALIHRFTLIKPGVKRAAGPAGPRIGSPTKGGDRNGTPTKVTASPMRMGSPTKGDRDRDRDEIPSPSSSYDGQLWPFGFFFSSAIAAKCDICAKRLGWKPVLECDDCGLRAHIRCGEEAPTDCGLRPARPRVPQAYPPASPISKAKAIPRTSQPNSPAHLPRR